VPAGALTVIGQPNAMNRDGVTTRLRGRARAARGTRGAPLFFSAGTREPPAHSRVGIVAGLDRMPSGVEEDMPIGNRGQLLHPLARGVAQKNGRKPTYSTIRKQVFRSTTKCAA